MKWNKLAVFFALSAALESQILAAPDTLFEHATLQSCLKYAILHQPVIQQLLLDERSTESSIQSKLADWYPQLNFNYDIQHYLQTPVSILQGNPARISPQNTSAAQFSLTQTIFNRDALLGSLSANDVRKLSREQTINSEIQTVVNVSKAYYSVLETEAQISLLDEDIIRLRQSLKDAYDQYKSGVVDNIDYKRATVSLNNALAEKRQNVEILKARYSSLKEQMGYPSSDYLDLAYDSIQMENEIYQDTTQVINYENRIEYQSLKTQKRLQEYELSYAKWGYLPSLNAFAAYNLNFQNDALTNLYRHNYPNSYIGIELSLPIFQGWRSLQEVRLANYQLERTDYDFQSLRNSLDAEYNLALANYKASLNTYKTLKDNLELADEVYKTVQLQYRAGTKTYLEVITAETDLRTTQVNYTNALYEVLSNKVDVQKALGIIKY